MDFLDIKEELKMTSVICRLCLVQNSTYYNVFDDEHLDTLIVDTLRSFIGIAISPLDNWPKSVCTGCVDKIQDFRTLLTKVKENEVRLVEIFGEYVAENKNSDSQSYKEVKVELKDTAKQNSDDCTSSVDIKEEVDDISSSSGEPRRRGRPKKRARRRKKVSPPVSDDESFSEDQLADSSLTVEKFEELSERRKEEKRLRDEKVDMEIHSFFKMECDLCQIKFPRFNEVQAHFRAVHKCRGYVICCGKKLNRPMKLYEHMNDHVNPTTHTCSVCLKNYKTQYGLQVHKKLRHTPPEEREFRCDQCTQSFVQMSRLKAHMITHMAPEEKKHICETCGRAFALASILVQHVRRVHENSCVSVCEVCAKIFRCKNLFKQHVAEHTSEKEPHVPCTICGKMFKHRIAMRKHMQRHNTSGPLECPICQRVAPNKPALTEHIKYKHKAQRVHKCTLCERSFKTALSLKEHMASHTGQVLYQCLFCPKQFNSNANYFRHNKMSHPLEWEAEKEKKRAERTG